MRRASRSFEEIVLRGLRLGLRRVAPRFEDVKIEEDDEDFAHHLPAAEETVGEAAFRFFEDVIQIVDDSMPLAISGARAEAIQRRFDLVRGLILRRNAI